MRWAQNQVNNLVDVAELAHIDQLNRMRSAKRATASPRKGGVGSRREGLSPVELSGWGHYPVVDGFQVESEDIERITQGVALTRGLGRSYGDASIPAAKRDLVAATPFADRLLSFDERSGILRAEAGCPLVKLNRLFFARGWFTPVTPGTHYVTLGGMAAADVHGKNHHGAGCFGEHVQRLKMRLADGTLLECSDVQEPDLFRATLGGMGLTGHILEVEVRMQRISSPWIWQESERLQDFEAVLERLQEAGRDWPYTVCWADFMARDPGSGRGLLMKGRWAEPAEAPAVLPKWRSTIEFPAQLPSWALQPWMIQIGNFLYYWQHSAAMQY